MVISEETLKARALFSQRLGILLNKYDMKQNELATFLGVSESTVGKWILGKSMPRTMGLVQKIADHFGVGKSYLLENDNSSSPSSDNTVQNKNIDSKDIINTLHQDGVMLDGRPLSPDEAERLRESIQLAIRQAKKTQGNKD